MRYGVIAVQRIKKLYVILKISSLLRNETWNLFVQAYNKYIIKYVQSAQD